MIVALAIRQSRKGSTIQSRAIRRMSDKSKQPRLSSTVVLLRRKPELNGHGQDFEVLLAQRSNKMKAFSSVYVFPGGVYEDTDKSTAKKYVEGEPTQDDAIKLCGIRELFEEAGVLLSSENGSKHAKAVFMPPKAQHEWQHRVHDDAKTFPNLLTELNVKPALSALHYWITFITPVMEPRRFETHFYIAVVDDCNVNLDGGETVRYTWTSPKDAIDLLEQGKISFLPPQFYVLSALKDFNKADDVINVASSRPRRLPIQPHSIGTDDDGNLILVYPGDEEHPTFKGKPSMLRRIKVKLPMGKGGYEFITNLPEEPHVKNWPGFASL